MKRANNLHNTALNSTAKTEKYISEANKIREVKEIGTCNLFNVESGVIISQVEKLAKE